jgi:hypothetical protein
MARDAGLLTGPGGTSRFPQTPSTGPLRGQAPSAPARDARLLKQRAIALAVWCGCLLLIVVPAVRRSAGNAGNAPFRQPMQPRPNPGLPLKL